MSHQKRQKLNDGNFSTNDNGLVRDFVIAEKKVNENRKNLKIELNHFLDSQMPGERLDLDKVKRFEKACFDTEFFEDEENNPSNPELYEKNELVDWEPPKTQEEIEEQYSIIKKGVAALHSTQEAYNNLVKETANKKTPKSERFTVPSRNSQLMDTSHPIINPREITRYSQGDYAKKLKIEAACSQSYDMACKFICKLLGSNPFNSGDLFEVSGKICRLVDSDNSKEHDAFMISKSVGVITFMLNPIIGVQNHHLLDSLVNSFSDTYLFINEQNENLQSQSYRNFTLFWIDCDKNEEIQYFLFLSFKYSNIDQNIIKVMSDKKSNDEDINDGELVNIMILENYCFIAIKGQKLNI
jgi:hypothetical protein